MPKHVMVDGFAIDAADPEVAATAINNLRTARDTAMAGLDEVRDTISARDATIAAKDAEISNLKDAAAAAVLSPQALRDAAASYSRTVHKAKALGAPVTDAMGETDAIAAAVRLKLGDKAAAYTPEQFSAAFDALEVPAGAAPMRDSLSIVLGDGLVPVNDAASLAAKAHDARMARYASAHEAK